MLPYFSDAAYKGQSKVWDMLLDLAWVSMLLADFDDRVARTYLRFFLWPSNDEVGGPRKRNNLMSTPTDKQWKLIDTHSCMCIGELFVADWLLHSLVQQV